MAKQKNSSPSKKRGFWGWIDANLLHWAFMLFIAGVALVPKFPIQHVEYTYIKIRVDDVLPAVMVGLFLIQWLRKKITLNTALLVPIVLFWISVFASFLYAYYVQLTIPIFNIGLLHSLRRVEYLSVFFLGSSLVTSEKRFKQYLGVYVLSFFVVSLYGVVQKFGILPSIQTMNPAYVDGRLLWLNSDDRINSTFGGHFDLAAYITFSIPIILGLYYQKLKKWYLVAFFTALVALLYTAARSSFVAYMASVTFMLLRMKKFAFYAVVLVVTGGLLLVTGDMTKRLLQTFQVKTVYTNPLTGVSQIGQKISVDNLPAGSYEINLPFIKKGKKTSSDSKEQLDAARQLIYDDVKRSGKTLTPDEIEAQARALTQFIKPEQTLLCDISCATRLQVEWPRAVLAFKSNPILGRGPSSITEATDNDFLRWLGELGLLGTSLFLFILYRVHRSAQTIKKHAPEMTPVVFGFFCGLSALLINALYIDVFEASKVAYNFWIVSGLFVGLATLYGAKQKTSK